MDHQESKKRASHHRLILSSWAGLAQPFWVDLVVGRNKAHDIFEASFSQVRSYNRTLLILLQLSPSNSSFKDREMERPNRGPVVGVRSDGVTEDELLSTTSWARDGVHQNFPLCQAWEELPLMNKPRVSSFVLFGNCLIATWNYSALKEED